MKDVVKTANSRPAQGRPRRRRRNMTLYYLMLFVLCVVIFLILARTVFFNIDEYIVTGNKIYSADKILEAGNLRDGRNMYGINLDKTAEKIKDNLIYIEDVELKRKLPNKFIVTVSEATACACCEYEGSRYAIITRTGRYLETEQLGARAGLMLIKGLDLKNVAIGEDFEPADETKKTIILELLESIGEICDGDITEIDITDRTNITMKYQDRIDIDFGSSLDYEYKLRYITAIITESLDPDAEGKIIYHSSAAGASFIKKEDLEITEQEKLASEQIAENTPSGENSSEEDGGGEEE